MIRLALLAACVAAPAAALEIGRSDWKYSAELASVGFEPFATSGVGNAIYGMRRGEQMYLCFILDTGAAQNERQAALLSELEGGSVVRDVPNIPVACVLTQ